MKVELDNFMCHRKFSMDLHPNMTFIVGENGSGKSAIFAAIQVCLGARASVTNRASTLSELVHNSDDADRAVVRITLTNTGPDRYAKEGSGDTISIERVIPKGSGASRYTLRCGSLVYQRVDQIHQVLAELNIHVDNPMVVMDQETSKKFISASEENFYHFFSEGTQLAPLRRILEESRELMASEVRIEDVEATVHARQLAYEEAKGPYDQLAEYMAIDAKIEELQALKEWAGGVAAKRANDKRFVELGKLDDRVADRESEVQGLHSALADAEKELEDVRLLEQDQASTVARQQAAVTEAEALVRKARAARAAATHSENEAVSRGRALEGTIKRVEGQLKERLDRNPDLRANALSNQSAALDACERERAAAQPLLTAAEAAMADAEQRLQEVTSQQSELRASYEDAERRFRGARDGLAAAQRGVGDIYSGYGTKMRQLVELIERNVSRFRVRPEGPLGCCVVLAPEHQKWAKAVEESLGARWRNFLVDNWDDGKILEGMAKSIGMSHGDFSLNVYRSLPEALVPSRRPDGFTFVIDVLTVKSMWAWNYLLDATDADMIVLFDSADEAKNAICVKGADGRFRSKFREVKSALTVDGRRVYERGGGYTERAASDFPVRFIRMDPEQHLDRARQRVSDAELETGSYRQQLEEADTTLGGARREVALLRADRDKHRKTLDKCARERVRAERMDIPVEEDEMVAELQARLEQLQEELDTAQQGRRDAESALTLAAEQVTVAEEQAQEAADRLAESDLRALRNRRSALESKRRQSQAAISANATHLQKLLEEQRSAQDKAKAEKLAVEREFERLCAVTGRVGPPADLSLTPEQATQELARLNKRREREASKFTGRNIDKIKREYKTKKAEYEEFAHRLLLLKECRDVISDAVSGRIDRTELTLESMSVKVNEQFCSLLEARGHTGSITFDHEKQAMTAKMIPGGVSLGKVSFGPGEGSLSTLSGGEKAYTSLSLLCAIGDQMDVPFRIFDEFDVYMDESIRTHALNMLASFCQKHPNKQFIFITPHAVKLTGIEADTYKILRLKAPRSHGV